MFSIKLSPWGHFAVKGLIRELSLYRRTVIGERRVIVSLSHVSYFDPKVISSVRRHTFCGCRLNTLG